MLTFKRNKMKLTKNLIIEKTRLPNFFLSNISIILMALHNIFYVVLCESGLISFVASSFFILQFYNQTILISPSLLVNYSKFISKWIRIVRSIVSIDNLIYHNWCKITSSIITMSQTSREYMYYFKVLEISLI